ncbi:MAG TPA: class I SAM-dependent methyltransferase [Acidimicrobiia bacterium]|nr:class I SAM-dependent methyltransferase [Acidimicrobiia bacterium]
MSVYDSRRYALVNRWDPQHLKTIDRLLPLAAGQRVLEVGCGSGHLTKRLAGKGVDIVGIDANPNAREVAGTQRVLCMQAERLEFDDQEFKAVISVHAIEHIPPLDAAIAEIARVLQPQGRALFIYPAEPVQGLYAIPTSVILYRTPFKARQVHCHKLWPAKLRRIVEPFGLTETHHEFNLWKSPQFVSVFTRN